MITPDLVRIEKAKDDRRLQLLRWEEYDGSYMSRYDNHDKVKPTKVVVFGPELVFLEATARGDISEVKRLIQSGIDPNVTNEDGLTALHQCCIDNNRDMCSLLLENHANVNARDNELWTPLHAAATCGHKELCSLLITWGADLLAVNVDGNMPYDLCDDADETLVLIENEMAKRDVTQSQIDEIRLRPEKDILVDLKRRLAENDDLQALDSQGAAPIHIACACGFLEVAQFLLQNNLDPHLPDRDGWLPIHIAVCWGQIEIVELLVGYGADMESSTRSGQTVYSICDSKELGQRLVEIWHRREDLRKAIRQNHPVQGFNRGRGSSRRKNNSSILRTSMRDKHRLTRAEAVREKQLGEQVEAEMSACAVTPTPPPPTPPPPTPPSLGPPSTGLLPDIGKFMSPALRPTPTHHIPAMAIDTRSTTTGANGTRATPKRSTATPVPPSASPMILRTFRPNGVEAPVCSRQGDLSSSLSRSSSSSSSINSPTNYVRPVQQQRAIDHPALSPANKSSHSRPQPPPRHHRNRIAQIDDQVVVGVVAETSADPVVRQDLPGGPSGVLETPSRPGERTPRQPTDACNTDTHSPTNKCRHRPFSCCYTM